MANEGQREGVPLTGKAVYDEDLYSSGSKTPYLSTAVDDEDAEADQQNDL
jgi:hypothetical protein